MAPTQDGAATDCRAPWRPHEETVRDRCGADAKCRLDAGLDARYATHGGATYHAPSFACVFVRGMTVRRLRRRRSETGPTGSPRLDRRRRVSREGGRFPRDRAPRRALGGPWFRSSRPVSDEEDGVIEIFLALFVATRSAAGVQPLHVPEAVRFLVAAGATRPAETMNNAADRP